MIWPGEGRRQRPDQTGGNGRDVALPWCAPRCRRCAPVLESVETMEPSTRGSSRRRRSDAVRGPLSSNHSFTAKVAATSALQVQCAEPRRSRSVVQLAVAAERYRVAARGGAFQTGCRPHMAFATYRTRARADFCCPTGLDHPGSAMRGARQPSTQNGVVRRRAI